MNKWRYSNRTVTHMPLKMYCVDNLVVINYQNLSPARLNADPILVQFKWHVTVLLEILTTQLEYNSLKQTHTKSLARRKHKAIW